MPFVYVKTPDEIEDVNYVKKNGVPLDYLAYVERQLMKPVTQLFALEIEQLPGYSAHYARYHFVERYIELSAVMSPVRAEEKLQEEKEAAVAFLLLNDLLTSARDEKLTWQTGQTTLGGYITGTVRAAKPATKTVRPPVVSHDLRSMPSFRPR